MNIVYRSDASSEIGSGHVIRSLTLAEELKKQGAEITFICRALKGNFNQFIYRKGINVVELLEPEDYGFSKEFILGENYKGWLGVSQEQDANETIIAMGDKNPEWLIVDHYSIGEKWEKKMRPHVKNIMVIDDLVNRSHDCELILDQNYSKNSIDRYKGKIPDSATELLGPKFALLKPVYNKARIKLRRKNNSIKRVLIYFGGSDPHNLIIKTLEAFNRPSLKSIFLDVILGPNHPRSKEILLICNSRGMAKCHNMLPHLADLMSYADLSIGAGGSTTWERLCLGLPSIVISTGKNQELASEALAKEGYHEYLGPAGSVTVDMIVEAIILLINSPEILEQQSNYGRALVDGMGVHRVLKKLLNYV